MKNLKLRAFSAFASFVFTVFHNVSGMENISTNDEIPRIRCLWSLGSGTHQAAALGILEKKISQESFQRDYKLRITYLKKLGEFLKENPRYPLDLEILKSDGENRPKISNFYEVTAEYIKKASLSKGEEEFQLLKVKTFYHYIPGEITRLSPEEHSKHWREIMGLDSALRRKLSNLEVNKLKYLKHFQYFNNSHIEPVSAAWQPKQNMFIGDQVMQAMQTTQITQTMQAMQAMQAAQAKRAQIMDIADDIKKAAEQAERSRNFTEAKSLKRLAAKIYFKIGKSIPSGGRGLAGKFSCYKESSELGYALATYYLAELLGTERYGEKESNFYDFPKAYQCYLSSARDNNLLSLYKVAKILEKGDGRANIAANREEAQDCYEKAAIQGHPYSQYKLAIELMKSHREKEGIALLQKAAESGYFKAQSYLAKYEKGYRSASKDSGLSLDQGEGREFNLKIEESQAVKQAKVKEVGQPIQMAEAETEKILAKLEAEKVRAAAQDKKIGELMEWTKEAQKQAQAAVLEKTKVEEQANKEIAGLNKEIAGLSKYIQEVEKQVEAEKARAATQDKEMEELESQVKESQKQAQTAGLEKTKIEEQANKEIVDLNKEIAGLNKYIQEIEKRAEAEKTRAAMQDERTEELEKQTEEAQKQAQMAAREKTEVEEQASKEIANLKGYIQEFQKQTEAEKIRAATQDKKMEELERRIEETQKQTQTAAREKTEVEEQASKEIAGLNKYIQEFQKQVEAEKARAAMQDKKIGELERRVEEAEKKGVSEKERGQDMANKLAVAQRNIGLLKKELATTQKNLKTSQQRLTELQKKNREKENKEAAGWKKKAENKQHAREAKRQDIQQQLKWRNLEDEKATQFMKGFQRYGSTYGGLFKVLDVMLEDYRGGTKTFTTKWIIGYVNRYGSRKDNNTMGTKGMVMA